MAKRKGISKKTRFEVFKRDSFKCQYCGRSAPEVILHVDHIKPVKENGENDIMNYVTACQDCNLGKGARKLSDSSEIEKQKRELDLLQERREQLDMMVQWRTGLETIKKSEVEAINSAMEESLHKTLTDHGKNEVSKLIKRYSFKEVLDAVYLSANYDSDKGDIIKYFNAICRNKREGAEKPYLSQLYYIRGILRNTLRDYERVKYRIMPTLEEQFLAGMSVDYMKDKAIASSSWGHYLTYTEENK
jgi:hypothetical protein